VASRYLGRHVDDGGCYDMAAGGTVASPLMGEHSSTTRGGARLVTGAMALMFLASVGGRVNMNLLLSSLPLYVISIGAGTLGAGLVTGVQMFATVAGELAVPRFLTRCGYRVAFGVGLVLLGVPALALRGSANLATVLVVGLLRGVGFGIVVVLGAALVAELAPAGRRGRGLGLYGVVVGVPTIISLPLGVWLTRRIGYPEVFTAAALAALAVLPAVLGLPRRRRAATRPLGILTGLRSAALLRPGFVFASTTMASGIIVTFLPDALDDPSGNVAAAALFLNAAAATLSRWWSGRYVDRYGPVRLLAPAVLVAAVGVLGFVLTAQPIAVMIGALLFGVGFGVAQTTSLALMLTRVSTSDYSTASAVWNLAYDAGIGLGGVVFGVLAEPIGYPAAFASTAVIMLAACLLARREQSRESDQRTGNDGLPRVSRPS
jgi:predicted MFS family arabinose efflux permease